MSVSIVYKIVNDVDDLIYIGSTNQILCKRMSDHRQLALKGRDIKLYNHMREVGAEHFKILCVREYKDISKERLRYKEDKYIKRFDTVKKGLNTYHAFGSTCEHKVSRNRCKECKGYQICSHDKLKYDCRDCGGQRFCHHNIQTKTCRECKGSCICPHNKLKQTCKECKGSKICSHNKQKDQCKMCSPAVCIICSKIFGGKSCLKKHQERKHPSPAEN